MSEDAASGGTQFIDANSDYRNPKEDDRTIRSIVMDHVRKITSLASKEMRGGYTNVHTTKIGDYEHSQAGYVEDTREEFCNSVLTLYDVVLAELEGRKTRTNWHKKFAEVFEEIQKLKTDTLAKTSLKETEILTGEYYKGRDDEFIVENYKQRRVEQFHILFRYCMGFLRECHYLATVGYIDG